MSPYLDDEPLPWWVIAIWLAFAAFVVWAVLWLVGIF
jgi:hypothetical protein